MNDKDCGKLDLRLDGTAGWYFERRQALRKNRTARATGRVKVLRPELAEKGRAR
jgi:hypothetical protein